MNELIIMEKEVCTLLQSYANSSYAHDMLAPMIAKKSLQKNHLYGDLGFKSRTEMGKFMKKNFPLLAVKKPKTKLWKKFIYDEINKIAPACMQCEDYINCFKCLSSEISA